MQLPYCTKGEHQNFDGGGGGKPITHAEAAHYPFRRFRRRKVAVEQPAINHPIISHKTELTMRCLTYEWTELLKRG